jgi:hypothetical protein
MNFFWENIVRYLRFLITSITGLIIVLLSPILKIAKKNIKMRLFIITLILLTFVFFISILQAMLNS